MFDTIAKAYDSANMASLGLQHMWKDVLVAKMDVQPGDRVADLATGTADIAIKVATVMTTEHPSAPTRKSGEALLLLSWAVCSTSTQASKCSMWPGTKFSLRDYIMLLR